MTWLLATMFESRERLEDLNQSVVANVNRVENKSTPIVDARLLDGSMVHVLLQPMALKGPAMTIAFGSYLQKQPIISGIWFEPNTIFLLVGYSYLWD
ncbi:hypothetical protein VN24_02915 [Paenibacillus beijingensis]|uniref:Uncharacterized protein n=2 Tax=Paenibacillus beijingensis TaxID=1126833 RepID=A0A0D5NEH0_9BACL|nr:hypothetical protein VN24_02915 [Paenibacillus beijingensis]